MADSRATLVWERDMVFRGRTPRGYDLDFDADAEWGCTPVEALLLSVGGCMAMDVVSILGKMRCPPSALSLEMEGDRAPEPPRRFTRMRLVFSFAGEGVTAEKAARAVDLSKEKYCSVLQSLRSDLDVEVVCRFGSTEEPA